jgi:hypothetical protein
MFRFYSVFDEQLLYKNPSSFLTEVVFSLNTNLVIPLEYKFEIIVLLSLISFFGKITQRLFLIHQCI